MKRILFRQKTNFFVMFSVIQTIEENKRSSGCHRKRNCPSFSKNRIPIFFITRIQKLRVLQIFWSRFSLPKSIPFIHEYPEHRQRKEKRVFIDYEDAFDFDFLFSF